MARKASRGVEKLLQPVPGDSSVAVIVKPDYTKPVRICTEDKRSFRQLASLGWRLNRARVAKRKAEAKEKAIRDLMLAIYAYLPEGMVGIESRIGSRSSMHVEFVQNYGRKVDDAPALLKLLRGKKVDVIKGIGLNTASLLADPAKLQRLIAALADIYGEPALVDLLILDMNWEAFDAGIKDKRIPKSAEKHIGPTVGSLRVDAKPL